MVKLALHDPHPRVRENAIRMIENTTDLEIQTEALLSDLIAYLQSGVVDAKP